MYAIPSGLLFSSRIVGAVGAGVAQGAAATSGGEGRGVDAGEGECRGEALGEGGERLPRVEEGQAGSGEGAAVRELVYLSY